MRISPPPANASARCRCAIRTSPSHEQRGGSHWEHGPPPCYSKMMMMSRQRTRREVGGLITASAVMIAAPAVLRAQPAARVVVIGGGFGGASCARALRQADGKLDVTLVEANTTFTSCPLSNEVI